MYCTIKRRKRRYPKSLTCTHCKHARTALTLLYNTPQRSLVADQNVVVTFPIPFLYHALHANDVM